METNEWSMIVHGVMIVHKDGYRVQWNQNCNTRIINVTLWATAIYIYGIRTALGSLDS